MKKSKRIPCGLSLLAPLDREKFTANLFKAPKASGCTLTVVLSRQTTATKTNKIYVANSVCEFKDKVIIKTTKTDASKRSMIILYAMIELLREHRKNFATGRFVFTNSDDKNNFQAPSNICRVYRKILSPSGIKSSLHILRHTNITNLITAGTDIKTVKVTYSVTYF